MTMLVFIRFAYMVMVCVFLFFEGNLPPAFDIRLCHQFGIDHEVERQRVLRLRFEQFDVDLSGDSFVTVDDGGGSFADLYGTHPRSGDILQTKGLCEASDSRCVLLQ